MKQVFFCSPALIKPSSDFYIHDEAGYLSQVEKEQILTKNHFYDNNQEKAQIAVVFLDNEKDNIDVDRYANDLAESWGIGNKETDNGVLILFAKNSGENNARIEVGYGLYW